MALQLEKTFLNGFVGNYWRLEKVIINVDGSSTYYLSLYKDETTRNTENSVPYCTIPCIGDTIVTTENEDIRIDWYQEIKRSHLDSDEIELNPFANAIDI
jgi:hypothetical protein